MARQGPPPGGRTRLRAETRYAARLAGVDCVFDARYEKQVAKIEQGDNVTVLGTCEGSYKYNVLLRDCEPVEE